MKVKSFYFICFMLLTSASVTEWRRTQNLYGIVSYIGTPTSKGITPTKVEMTVSATPEKAVKVITNLNNYKLWLPYCKTSYVIQQVSDTVSYGYLRMSLPIVTDRDVAVRCTVHKTAGNSYEVLVTAVPNLKKEEIDAFRIKHFTSRYTVKADANGKTFIRQITEVDIGGNIPDFLIDWINELQPLETFQKLRKLITG